MSIIPIQTVRGEHNIATSPSVVIDTSQAISAHDATLATGLGVEVNGVSLESWQGRAVWNVTADSGSALVDAYDGSVLTPVNREQAIMIAQSDYAGDPAIAEIEYFSGPTGESRRPVPSWRISFYDGEGTRIYVSEETGEVIARRNDAWRLYDFFWMLHIMDYDERENFNNPLVITAALFAFVTVMAGLLLLVLRLQRMVRMEIAARRRKPH